jgi:hypothetical protein
MEWMNVDRGENGGEEAEEASHVAGDSVVMIKEQH